MTAPTIQKEIFIEFEKEFYHEQLEILIKPTSAKFQRILRSYVVFNLFFCSLIFLEILYLLFHLTFFVQTFVLAIHLALIFATIFSYFTLRLYFQTKTTERYFSLKSDFIHSCQQNLNYQEGIPEHHLIMASACCRLATHLHGKEYEVYPLPSWLDFLSPPLEKLSCWCHWKDVHFIKEILLQASIDEHIKLVKSEPTHLEAHANLANAYVMLSGLYVDPRTVDGLDDERWIPPNKYTEAFKRKFRSIAERAIEEFKILSDYAPHDPWVHAQLAYSYRDLQMPKEEIEEYETILRLCPDDKEALFKLGKLYFQQGFNAKGLQVYEILKRSNYKKAENLIHFYGSYRLPE
jgi:tetratricopeptide (TPR) repeat protein